MLLGIVAVAGLVGTPVDDFDRAIAPVLARRCLGCHAGDDPKGGLDLTRRESALRGGEGGPAIEPGKPDESPLWEYVEDGSMPPKKPLPDLEKAVLKAWIADGAPWGAGPIDPARYTTDQRAGRDWWAWQPLRRPPVPKADTRDSGTNPIDAFISERRKAAGLQASLPVDRRSYLRRLSFDLLGLPPSPEEIDAFLLDDRPDAVERLVDRWLASPQYGVRWARPWLDLARYGESHGFEHDEFRPDAWRYRDWVVNALNEDMPYGEFARRQLAGDVLRPDDPGSIEATGFLVAGAYDSVGQTQQSEAMRKVVRQDELEDIVGAVSQTFLGVTVHCARCHDHKFDPIPQADYYRLASALDGVRHGVRDLGPLDPPAIDAKRRIAAIRARLDEIAEPAMARLQAERRFEALPEPFLAWDFTEPSGSGPRLELKGASWTPEGLKLDGSAGYAASPPIARHLKAKTLEAWVRLANTSQRGGAAISLQTPDGGRFDAIVFGEIEGGRWMAGSEGFARTRSFNGPVEADDQPIHVAIAYHDDGKIVAYRNGQPYGTAYRGGGPLPFEGGQYQVLIGLRHGIGPGGNRMLAGDVIRARVYDRALADDEIAASARAGKAVDPKVIAEALPSDARDEWGRLRSELAKASEALAAHSRMAYVATPRKPGITHRLARGDTRTPAEAVSAGGLGLLPSPASDFNLAPDANDADRRRKLAEWITDPANPLFARTIANRLWRWHFGNGLVETPSDLGFNGGRPSHPELLDWLAAELIDHNGSLKHLHRLIVTSSTYAQASAARPEAMKVDVSNRWLWRKAPTRLEAEMVRDAMLSVAGRLDLAPGGPGFREFAVSKAVGTTTHRYTPVDPLGPGMERRTLFRTWARGGRSGFLDAFDCPDPSTIVPARAVTNTPTQALALLNDRITLDLADRFAERLRREAGDDPDRQVQRAYRLAFGRSPDPAEQGAARSAIDRGGLEVLTRVLFNANEFLFLD